MAWKVAVEDDAKKSLGALDKPVRERIIKKLLQLEREGHESRHLKHGMPFFVEEAGGYRIAFKAREAEKTKRVYFIGDHKEYERWYGNLPY